MTKSPDTRSLLTHGKDRKKRVSAHVRTQTVQARVSEGNKRLGRLIVLAEPADKVCNALGVFPRLHGSTLRGAPTCISPRGSEKETRWASRSLYSSADYGSSAPVRSRPLPWR